MKVTERGKRKLIETAMAPFADKPLIVILGAMRSGSSLLTQLMTSHPAILGYGESKLRYHDPLATRHLALRALRDRLRTPWSTRYLLDKVLDPEYLGDVEALSLRTRLLIVTLLREPNGNVASLTRRFAERDDWRDRDPLVYYERQLGEVAALLSELPPTVPLLGLTYTQLIENTDMTLERLRQFLDLDQPFAANYRPSRTAGRWGIGDGSPNIRSGSVLNLEREAPQADERAWAAYRTAADAIAHRDPTFVDDQA